MSVATVSYVLNDGPRPVTEDTRRKILSAMRQLDYEPNVSARRLRTQRTQVLGLAIAGMVPLPVPADRYFLDVLRGVATAVDQHGYDLMLFSQASRIQSEAFYPTLARRRMVDGLIVGGSRFNYDSITSADIKRLPVVVVGRQYSRTRLRSVVFNYEEDAYQVTRALIAMGHRRIGMLLNSPVLSSENERLAGYQRAMDEAGLHRDPHLVHVSERIVQYPDPKAVLAVVQDARATALITGPHVEVCEQLVSAGLGRDVAVATLEDEAHTVHPEPLVIGVQLDKIAAGARAVNMLMEVIKGNRSVPEHEVVPTKLQFYGAAGAAARSRAQ